MQQNDAALILPRDLRYLLSGLLVVPLRVALLLESPPEPEVDLLLLALSFDPLLPPLELLSAPLELGEALPFPLPSLFSFAAEAESETPSELPDPFDPFVDGDEWFA
jgi:hypothetical protein